MSIPLLPPERIGDFEIVSKLGAGGMGMVYLARQIVTGEQVALKVMHAEHAKQDMLRRRFVREARATMALDHPNIIRIRESFTHEGAPVIAMEVLRGLSLKEYLVQERKLSVPEAAGIFVRVVSAVGAAHALGLVHRDLKPDNIFLLPDSPFVKVLDFGIAKLSKGGALAETSALTKTGTMIGTPYYMSPEQAFGEKTIDHRSDIWSLGIMAYEALTGTLLTYGATLEEVFSRLVAGVFPRLDSVDATIPADVADLVERMVQRNRDKRPEDLREVFATFTRHAPEVGLEATVFEAAADPLAFDDPTSTTGSGQKKAIQARSSPESAPIKLAAPVISKAQSARASDEERLSSAGTLILEGAPPRPSLAKVPFVGTVIMEAPTAPDTPAAKRALASTADEPAVDHSVPDSIHPPMRAGINWIWVLAAILVLGCIGVLWRQFH